jgi:CPA2 family monovalent cation:H+ antiporter-2
MIAEAELLFQLGAIMLLAFVAATIAGRVNQSVMIGYIVIGILIGPKISLEFLGFEYHGLISDTSLIEILSFVGLIMLMFFVGLEFSFSKLKKTRTPAIILAVIDTSVGLFVGFVFASFLDWPLIDSIFLAGVIAMSSTSIAMKILFDLKRMSSPEVEFLIGLVVVETFIAMLILTVASGMIVRPDANAWEFGELLLALAAFYGFFVWVAMAAVPRVVAFFNSIDNDELFILFVLGIVFLTSGLAQVMNVPPIIGAFFIGMILAESKVSIRVQSKLESFKDAFVAIFFTSFGMMIDPAMFGTVMWLVLLAIIIVVLYEAFVMSAISYFMGFSSKASTTIGTSMCGRGVESILYASVGSNVQGATMGAQLNPFAGAFCFGMSAITPALVKHSSKFANALSRLIPRSLKFSGAVVSRTLGKAVMPASVKLFKGARFTGTLLILFAMVCVSILLTESLLHMLLILVGVVFMAALYYAIRYEVSEIARHVNYANIGVATNDRRVVVNLVSGVVLGAVASVLFIVSTWEFIWQVSLLAAAAYVAFLALTMRWAFNVLYSEGTDSPQKVFGFPRPPGVDDQSDDLLPDVPKPVYNVIRAAPVPGEVRL